jgi:hypothetical protein
MRPVLTAALPKAKYNRNFPRAPLYGPGSHQGCEIHNLYTSQVIEHLDVALRHGPFNIMTSELMRGSLEVLTTELGLPGKPLAHPFCTHTKLVTDSWWKDVWKETDNGEIRLVTHPQQLRYYCRRRRWMMDDTLEFVQLVVCYFGSERRNLHLPPQNVFGPKD